MGEPLDAGLGEQDNEFILRGVEIRCDPGDRLAMPLVRSYIDAVGGVLEKVDPANNRIVAGIACRHYAELWEKRYVKSVCCPEFDDRPNV